MEAKINIEEILKDKPQGTKLHDLLYNVDVELDKISTTDTETVVWCTNETDNNTTCHRGYSEFGTVRGCPDGLQILLPSKEMRNWSKFAWKKGDILVGCAKKIIFDRFTDDTYSYFEGKYCLEQDPYSDYETYRGEDKGLLTKYFHIPEQCIAQSYIKNIEERLGGKLNMETLEIEKAQPEFKDGDIVCISGMGYLAYGIVKSIDYSSKKLEYYVLNDMSILKFGDWLSFEDKHIQPITETQQIILFEDLSKEGKAWDAEKKEVVVLKPKCEFKPFDRCIWKIRNCEGSIWQASFVSYVDEYGATPMGMSIDEDLVNLIILPYNKETAKLIGTTDNWEGNNN